MRRPVTRLHGDDVVASHFSCIGLSVRCSEEISRLLTRLFERVEWVSTADGGQHGSWTDESGAIVMVNAHATYYASQTG